MADNQGDTPITGTPAAVTDPAEAAATTDQAAAAAATTDQAAVADPAAETPKGEDWATLRVKYAKGDEKLEKRLSRYSSAEAAIDALIAAQNKIASGGLKEPLPKDATPEQLEAWRVDNGIPAKPEEYDLTLPDGRVIGEEDKVLVDEFLKSAHAQNMTPDQVKSTVGWYLAEQERQIEARHQQDAEEKEQGEGALREEWGSEYKLNLNLIGGLLDTAPEGVKDQFLGGRLADGTPIGNDAKTLRWLANLARTVNPTATVVPGAGGNAMQAIENEKADIEKLMGDRKSEYWKGPKAEAMQKRYRELVDVQGKMK